MYYFVILTSADPNFSWVVGLKEFAHPPGEIFSAVARIGPTFFLAVAMFGFVFQISSLVTEKELKLRQVFKFYCLKVRSAQVLLIPCKIIHVSNVMSLVLQQVMTMMGLYDSAYWLSWLTWEGTLVLLSSLFIVIFGMMFQFDFFLNNSFAVLFLLFFLFELNMVSTFLSNPHGILQTFALMLEKPSKHKLNMFHLDLILTDSWC